MTPKTLIFALVSLTTVFASSAFAMGARPPTKQQIAQVAAATPIPSRPATAPSTAPQTAAQTAPTPTPEYANIEYSFSDQVALGYKGQGTQLTVIGDTSSNAYLRGRIANSNGGWSTWSSYNVDLQRGTWTGTIVDGLTSSKWIGGTREFVGSGVTLRYVDTNAVPISSGSSPITLATNKLNVVVVQPTWTLLNSNANQYKSDAILAANSNLFPLLTSVHRAARDGTAVVIRAAGDNSGRNLSTSYNTVNGATYDLMNVSISKSASGIIVGSTDRDPYLGMVTRASYSNKPGADTDMQNRFILAANTTKFGYQDSTENSAAVVAAAATMVASKFTTATPTQVANQLLNTARTDIITNYSAAEHGKGVLSLQRAMAPTSLR